MMARSLPSSRLGSASRASSRLDSQPLVVASCTAGAAWSGAACTASTACPAAATTAARSLLEPPLLLLAPGATASKAPPAVSFSAAGAAAGATPAAGVSDPPESPLLAGGPVGAGEAPAPGCLLPLSPRAARSLARRCSRGTTAPAHSSRKSWGTPVRGARGNLQVCSA